MAVAALMVCLMADPLYQGAPLMVCQSCKPSSDCFIVPAET